jgi:hypothetical protein
LPIASYLTAEGGEGKWFLFDVAMFLLKGAFLSGFIWMLWGAI